MIDSGRERRRVCWGWPQSTYRSGVEIEGSVFALSAGAYTTTLYVMVDIVKGGGRAPQPSPMAAGKFFHHEGIYARKWPLPLCVGVAVNLLICERGAVAVHARHSLMISLHNSAIPLEWEVQIRRKPIVFSLIYSLGERHAEGEMGEEARSRIHEHTISLRFLGITWEFSDVRFPYTMFTSTLQTSFKPLWGGGSVSRGDCE
jgi:hypothetical protein